ncbi:MAG TPA: Na+/H+ antiporter NhaA [Burkholderiales bacterium]|jgi:NhaA family Na+:H+ antiporter
MPIQYLARAGGRIAEAVGEFLRLESAGGILLMIATAAALVFANTGAEGLYQAFLGTPVEIRIGAFMLGKPLILWINDGLMAVFFFLVGLEIKREVVEGELANRSQLALPTLAAAGGMAAPAAVFWLVNRHDPVALQGWAIPAATDIAFALGVLALLGNRVPQSLKVFLLTLAILDDLGAIAIIAIFYTDTLSLLSLAVAGSALVVLTILNLRHVTAIPPYLLVGLVLWVAVLESGVHATLAGVALALFIPIRPREEGGRSPLRSLEHDLHPAVAYAILPLFAFANAGVSFEGVSLRYALQPLPLGIALGLVIGKVVGVFGMTALAIGARIARLPEGAGWTSLLGISMLCGIGFTMSLFIANLAFGDDAPQYAVSAVIGVLIGSACAATLGYLLLRFTSARRVEAADQHTI